MTASIAELHSVVHRDGIEPCTIGKNVNKGDCPITTDTAALANSPILCPQALPAMIVFGTKLAEQPKLGPNKFAANVDVISNKSISFSMRFNQ
jgi:hypothetical protein